MIAGLEHAGRQHSIGVRMTKHIRRAVEQVDEAAWRTIDYLVEGEAQSARPSTMAGG